MLAYCYAGEDGIQAVPLEANLWENVMTTAVTTRFDCIEAAPPHETAKSLLRQLADHLLNRPDDRQPAMDALNDALGDIVLDALIAAGDTPKRRAARDAELHAGYRHSATTNARLAEIEREREALRRAETAFRAALQRLLRGTCQESGRRPDHA
jgi:hypothetical protein